jgi:nucleoside-diphosphate-sugar epimerase
VRDLVALAIAAAGRPADHPVRSEGSTPGDQFAMVADPTRAREELGWTATRSLPDGLQRMADAAREAVR